MARVTPFASLFGSSPFKPMQEHIRVVVDCAGQVPELFEALAAGEMNIDESLWQALQAIAD